MNVNLVVLAGRLTRDPESRKTPNSTVCNFGIAVNEYYKVGDEKKERALFIDVEAWAWLAEFITKNFSRGKEIHLQGSLRYEQWEAKDGSGKRSKVYMNAERVEFVGARDPNEPPRNESF